MQVRHAAVWLDHKEAKIFHVDAEDTTPSVVHAPKHHLHRHPVATAEHAHPADAAHFFHDVARSLADAEEILVVGPGSAKLEFVKHLHAHERPLEGRLVGVETMDHPTDGELVKFVRGYFRAADRLR